MSLKNTNFVKKIIGLITESEYDFYIELPSDILTLNQIFKKHGKKLLIVGGAVRDAKLGKKPKDFDLVTNALPDEVENILNSEKIYNFPSGKNFGIISAVLNGETYEIATFRTDNYSDTSDGRRPTSVTFGDIEGDAMRRDLTINALYYDIDRKKIIDLVGGMDDLENKKIKPVGNAMSRFKEDRLRTLRALRFAHRFGSKLDRQTIDAIVHYKDLPGVSSERIRDEFYKALNSSQKPEEFLEQFLSLGLGQRTFGKVHLDTRHVPELRNPVLVLAKLLWNNDDNLISKSLSDFKAKDKIKGVLFLKSLYQHFKDFDKLVFDPSIDDKWLNQLFKAKSLMIGSGILTVEDMLLWAKIMGFEGKVISEFVKYSPPISAKDFPEMKQSAELGYKISFENAKLFLQRL